MAELKFLVKTSDGNVIFVNPLELFSLFEAQKAQRKQFLLNTLYKRFV